MTATTNSPHGVAMYWHWKTAVRLSCPDLPITEKPSPNKENIPGNFVQHEIAG
jgi:hypothetical protein